MPTIDQDLSDQVQSQLLNLAKKFERQQLYQKQQKVYTYYFQLQPTSASSPQIFQKYCKCLKKQNKKNKLIKVYDYMLQIFKKNQNKAKTYKNYIDDLMQNNQYERIQQLVEQAPLIFHDDTQILISYVRACSRLTKYEKALFILEQYRQRNNQKAINSSAYWCWNIQLKYVLGKLQAAYQACNQCIFTKNQSVIYYAFNKCQICLMLKKYQQSVTSVDFVLKNKQPSKQRRLFVYLTKSYCLYKLNWINQSINALELFIKQRTEESIYNYKYILLQFIVLQQQKIIQEYQGIKKQIKCLVSFMRECFGVQYFSKGTYCKYFFNSYHLETFVNYFQLLLDCYFAMKYCFKQLKQYVEQLFLFTMSSIVDIEQWKIRLQKMKKQIQIICQEKQELNKRQQKQNKDLQSQSQNNKTQNQIQSKPQLQVKNQAEVQIKVSDLIKSEKQQKNKIKY